jgi:nucleotidyltransferase substrate binding protein (TIGR01987 family)
MLDDDIRWKQHFKSYNKVLEQLSRYKDQPKLNELEERWLIKMFEYNYELACKTLKDFLEYQGEINILDYHDIVKTAFKHELLGVKQSEKTGQIWLAMIDSRNMTSYTYNDDTVQEIITAINDRYFAAFCDLRDKLTSYLNSE